MVIFDNPASVPAPAGQYSHVARVELAGPSCNCPAKSPSTRTAKSSAPT